MIERVGAYTRSRVIVGIATGAVMLSALAGCSFASTTNQAKDRVAPASTPAATPAEAGATPDTATAAPATATPAPAKGLVVATADLAAPDGSVRMHLSVQATGNDDYQIVVSDFHQEGTATHDVFFRQFDEQPGWCIEKGVSFGHEPWGEASGELSPQSPISLSQAGDDPSFLKDVVLTGVPTGALASNCGWEVEAVAPLTWRVPDRHPNLDVRDSGPAARARGSVAMHGSVPGVYTVAAGDTLLGIEARFGISQSDLDFLRVASVATYMGPITAGLKINLDPATRSVDPS